MYVNDKAHKTRDRNAGHSITKGKARMRVGVNERSWNDLSSYSGMRRKDVLQRVECISRARQESPEQ